MRIIFYFLSYFFSPSKKKKKDTALQVVEFLYQAAPECLKMRDNNGNTPLESSILHSYPPVVDYLSKKLDSKRFISHIFLINIRYCHRNKREIDLNNIGIFSSSLPPPPLPVPSLIFVSKIGDGKWAF